MNTSAPGWFSPGDCVLEDFAEVLDESVAAGDYPSAARVDQGVVIYDSADIRGRLTDPAQRRAIISEITRVLDAGPGAALFTGAFDGDVVDAASSTFRRIIADEKAAGTAPGDHFAEAGANDRVWNALEKLAITDPKVFVHYYANDVLAVACEAWLGPGYQVTSQLNQVNPGGKAQTPHRDYHLGFQSLDSAQTYPAHVHALSPRLTLQGAVAHCDMPLESGPTFLLPHSHKYPPGYVAFHLPEFQECAAQRSVQIPLRKGDALFFNPALFHGAGSNVSQDIQRLGNLLQISSAFGRAMEDVNRAAVVTAIYPELRTFQDSGAGAQGVSNVVAASAEGYPFPLDLDRRQPTDGAIPKSQADLLREALADDWPVDRLVRALGDLKG